MATNDFKINYSIFGTSFRLINMLKKLLVLCLLLQIALGLCGTGCLKCDPYDQCLVCDTTSFYNHFGSCYRYLQPSCNIIGHDGLCNQCAARHYLDSNLGRCVPVPLQNQVSNCELYDSQRLCIRCVAGFYVFDSGCSAVPTAISNCEFYTPTEGCGKCELGFLYSPEKTSCVPIPLAANCAAYSFVKCFQCEDYHYLNPNLVYDLFNGSRPSAILTNMQEMAKGHVTDWFNLPTCIKVQDLHCQHPSSLTTCDQCESGYFVNSSQICEIILPSLPNCATKRDDNNDCLTCDILYYRNAEMSCSQRTVTNCLEYYVDLDLCFSCNPGDYSDMALCFPRTYTGCSTYDANFDRCTACVAIKFLTADKKCQIRTMTACQIYNLNSDTCVSCYLSTHYLDANNKCLARSGSLRCNGLDDRADKCKRCAQFQTGADNCNSCNQTQDYLNMATETCVDRTRENCKEFNQIADSCVSCKDGEYLLVSGSVKSCEINNAQNCLKKSTTANLCESCVATAYFESGQCKFYTVSSCSLWSPTSNVCLFCPVNYYKNPAKSCVQYTISNCDIRDPNNNACYSCLDGLWKNGNICVTNTSTGCLVKSRIANECASCPNNYYFNGSKSCVAITQTNCDQNVANADACRVCSPGYFLEGTSCIKFSEAVAYCIEYTGATTCTTCSSLYLLASTSNCAPIATSSLIADCIEYNNKVSAVTCKRCVETKKLISNTCVSRTSSVSLCKVHHVSDEKCQTCDTGRTTTTDGLKCLPVIADCQTYEPSTSATTALKCKYCIAGKKPKASQDGCEAGIVANCGTYNTDGSCQTCNQGYFSSTGACSPHSATFVQCNTMSVTLKNVCSTCNLGFFPVTLDSICSAVTAITNCLAYNSDGSRCTKCKANFYVNGSGQCQANPENCSQMKADGSSCEVCVSGCYFDGGNCVKPSAYIENQCLTFVQTKPMPTANDAAVFCSACKANTYPVKIGLGSVCIENDNLKFKGISSTVTDCIRYSNHSTPRCVECTSGKVINDSEAATSACVDSCDAGKVLVLDNLNGMYNACVSVSLPGCKTAVRITIGNNNASSFACIKGIADYLPVISNFVQNNPKLAHEIDYSGLATYTTYPKKLHYAGIAVNFEDITSTREVTTASDCDIYWLTNSKHICYRGSFGKASKWKVEEGGSITFSSPAVSDCDSNKKYTGYPSSVNALLSCYKCTTAANSIVANIQLQTSASGPWIGLQEDVDSVQCLSLPIAQENLVFTGDNCAAFGRFKANDSADIKVRCLACLPGYRGTTPDSLYQSVSSCTAIANCNTGSASNTVINRCSVCNSGYVPKDENMEECVETDETNCLIASTQLPASTKYNCGQCKYGYRLNADEKCETFSIASCDDTSVSIFGEVTNQNLMKYLIFETVAQKKIQGCNQCTGKTLVNLPATERQCVASPYVTANSFPAITSYIANCSSYSLTMLSSPAIFMCEKCAANYIPLMNKSKCVSQISNCAYADNAKTTTCAECMTDYVLSLVSGCTQPVIANCKTYNASRQCTECVDEYFVFNSGASCKKCTLSNCKTCSPDSVNTCTACKDRFILGTYKDGNKFCFAMSSIDANCLTAVEDSTTGIGISKFKCISCSQTEANGYIPKPVADVANASTLLKTFCMGNVFSVADCKEYDNSNSVLAQNSFNCLKCDVLKYLTPPCLYCGTNQADGKNGQVCAAYPITVLNCRNYSSTTVCESCEPHFYLSSNKCEPVTTIVNYCLRYLNATTCFKCQDNFWLNSATNSCLKITVTNCSVYLDQDKCSTCVDGYLPNSSTKLCDKITAIDCKTYTDFKTCKTCENSMYLKTTVGVTSCVPVDFGGCTSPTSTTSPFCPGCLDGFSYDSSQGICTQVVVNGCAVFSGPNCTTCPVNKFLIGAECKDPTVVIANCDVYESQTTCKTCQNGFVNSTNKQACVNASSIPNCTELDAIPEKCKTCTTGLFPKNSNGTSCVPPIPINNCKTYSGEVTCSACNTNYRLESNQCNLQQTIAKCVTYASSTTCGTCELGYVPNGTTCVLVVSNCNVIATQTTCATCKQGYVLHQSKTNCFLILSYIIGCIEYATSFTCMTCQTGYLPYQGNCYKINPIANCATWSSFNLCSSCESDFYLSRNTCTRIDGCLDTFADYYNGLFCNYCSKPLVVSADRRSCVSSYDRYLDGKCQVSMLTDYPDCTLCESGFYFGGDGFCTGCSASTPSNGCFNCDPTNQSVCLLCKSGFYQTSTGECIQNVVLLDPKSSDPIPIPENNATNSSNGVVNPPIISNTTNITNSTDASNSTNTNINATDNTTDSDSAVFNQSIALISCKLLIVLLSVIR